MISLNQYQESASKFAVYQHPDYPFLALGEESGEVLGKLAKFVRKNDTTLNNALFQAKANRTAKHKELRSDLIYELGDVLWQLSQCAESIGVSLEEIAAINIGKLVERKENNTIVGTGDKR